MIVTLILNLIVLILGTIFLWLPVVDTLPQIVGFDLDSALVTGVSQLKFVFEYFWPLGIVFDGFLFLMVYYTLKVVLKFFLGHRAP